MNETSYETVLSNLKTSLNKRVECEVERGTFSSHFGTVLYDCEQFVDQVGNRRFLLLPTLALGTYLLYSSNRLSLIAAID